jgi:hypothetical protein
MTGIMKLIFN